MEAGRHETRAWLVRAAPAKAGLADVVCRFGNATGKSVVHRPCLPTTPGLPRCQQPAHAQSLPRQTSALSPRDVLSLSVHIRRRASSDRCVVETGGASRISPNTLAGPVPVKRRSLERHTFRHIFAARWRKKNRSSPKVL